MKTNYRLKNNQTLTIIPIGDIHIGSEEFNQDFFEYSLTRIEEIPGEVLIYLMGDLLEVATKKLANSAFRATMTVNKQLDTIIDYLRPYKKSIRFCCIGNHEIRLSKDYDFNILKLVAEALECPYGHQNIDTININNQPFSIYTAHGAGSSKYFYTAESKMIRDTQHITADLYLHGHNHRCGYFTQPTRGPTGFHRRHYAFTGAFLSYGGYADMMQLPVLPEAFLHLKINKDQRLRPNFFYIDQVRPDLMEL